MRIIFLVLLEKQQHLLIVSKMYWHTGCFPCSCKFITQQNANGFYYPTLVRKGGRIFARQKSSVVTISVAPDPTQHNSLPLHRSILVWPLLDLLNLPLEAAGQWQGVKVRGLSSNSSKTLYSSKYSWAAYYWCYVHSIHSLPWQVHLLYPSQEYPKHQLPLGDDLYCYRHYYHHCHQCHQHHLQLSPENPIGTQIIKSLSMYTFTQLTSSYLSCSTEEFEFSMKDRKDFTKELNVLNFSEMDRGQINPLSPSTSSRS